EHPPPAREPEPTSLPRARPGGPRRRAHSARPCPLRPAPATRAEVLDRRNGSWRARAAPATR
ncbi:hypothetical protein, partial [Streptomyces sp. NPDC059491]|uniref:hypothetical protein n=1 Tax=Streptomyces sp. NPDC059491 TaxID=3346850 RepID=UPI0036A6F997